MAQLAYSRKLLLLQVGRGAAANLVVLFHLHAVQHKYFDGAFLPDASRLGAAGVDFFFVLSGFIMAGVAGRGISAAHFLWQRAVRIYPMYWLMTLIVLAVWMARPDMVNASMEGPVSLWRSFALFPADNLPLLAVGWTLVFEVYFYLVFAAIMASRLSLASGLCIWFGGYCCASFAAPSASSPVIHLMTSPLNLEFMAGAAIGIAWKSVPLPFQRLSKTIAALVTLACLSIAARLDVIASPGLEWLRAALFGIPSALIVYALSAAEQKRSISVPRLLTQLGDWSYVVYLSHVLILSALGRLIAVTDRGAFGAAILVGAGPIAANVAGWALHRFAEQPTLAFLYGLWPKSKAREPVLEKCR